MRQDDALAKALDVHASAVEMLVGAAVPFSESAWNEPLGVGKWSPAEILAHLICTYDTVIGELRGGSGMKIRTKLIARMFLRLTLVPRLLAGKPFPGGAVAPRETRPSGGVDRDDGLELFRRRAEELVEAARTAPPNRRVTHAYFGSSGVADGVLLCARHIQHHATQLSRPKP